MDGFISSVLHPTAVCELGQAEIAPGPGKVVIDFDIRDMYFKREEESASPNYNRNLLSVKMVEREGQDIVKAISIPAFYFIYTILSEAILVSTPSVQRPETQPKS
nr:hypothetical protein L203_01798 [Cryptococcus depauperatus CBS 7841]